VKPDASSADPRAVLFAGILVAMSTGFVVREVIGPGARVGAAINRVQAASERGLAARSVAGLLQILDARSESAEDWARAGRVLVTTDPVAAAEHFRRAADLDPHALYRYELAKALAAGGEPGEAWQVLQEVFARKPEHADALMLAAALTASEGHVEHALGLWISALEHDPSDPDRPRWDPRFDPVRSDPRFVEALVALRVPGTFVPDPKRPPDPAG
jgi:tetratricopeptide (TPR) repeat protein